MADLWYPDGLHDPAPASGDRAAGGGPKFLLHTTEGGLGVYTPSPPGPGRLYFGHTYWPTYTLARTPGGWRVYRHVPANRSARALANAAGGVETNRCDVTQVEIAWKAGEIASLPPEALDELARLLAWEHRARGVPLTSDVRWAGSEGFGTGASQRLSGPAWTAYAGVLGHQHAPENAHWDPGRFPVGALLSSARLHAADPGRPPAVPAPDPGRADNRFRGFPTLRAGDRDGPSDRVAAGRADPRLIDAALPVLTAQTWLNLAADARLRRDGDYGGLTQAAVRRFQSRRRDRGAALAVDGVCGPATWSALDAAADGG